MYENFRPDGKIGFQNMFYTKCINIIIDIVTLRSIYKLFLHTG